MKKFLLCFLGFITTFLAAQPLPYLDPKQPLETRVQDLLKRLTPDEKALQINNASPAIERLQIPAYDWWNEALHGVARAGLATSFPQPIGIAAGFNTNAVTAMGNMVSDEARAKFHQFAKEGQRGLYQGLTFYSPNINIFRDPRWGRGHETFGEDPFLTGKMGIAFVKAMQGSDPTYYKTICTAKHFAVHSGPEPSRHVFDAAPSRTDLWETYLPAFKMLAQDAKVYSFMCAYNRLYGEPCCSNPMLLSEILRKQWGFNGFIATDCGAVYDMFMFHHTAEDSIVGMAQAIRAGVDNHCLGYTKAVLPAIKRGLLTMPELDTAVARLIRARIKLGVFDADSLNPFSSIPYNVVNSDAHRKQALQMAQESIVLLKNAGRILPLSKSFKNIAVIGPNANDTIVPLGNYNGDPAHVITPLEAFIKQVGTTGRVTYTKGCHITDTVDYNRQADFKPALENAAAADVIVFVGGISPRLEGEELQVNVEGFKGGDKTTLDLPAVQTALLKELKKTGKPIVLVLMNGSALSINWENENINAIVDAWYGGEAAGQAIADVLFGKYNPAGRLPVTFYRSVNDLPAFENYDMSGRTYRYCTKPVLYPFGYGLSYTSFAYKNLKVSPGEVNTKKVQVSVSLQVTNIGKMAGDEVIQLYIHQQGNKAIKELKGFQRVYLKAGETKTIDFNLLQADLLHYNKSTDGLQVIPGKMAIMVGVSSGDIRLNGSLTLE
ncbi:MAG: glycoside hydrolase family 3 C-terminal domain-containing protein [Bacteroidota bacterium]